METHRLKEIDAAPEWTRAGTATREESAALFRAVLNLFDRWNVSDADAATLLDLAPRTYARWKSGEPGRMGRDTRARLSNLLGIHKALRILFIEPERGYGWISRPNHLFGDVSALDVMRGGELTDLMRVRRALDAERGLW